MSASKKKQSRKNLPPLRTPAQNVDSLLKKLLPLLPENEHQALFVELEKPLRSALRINPLKTRENESLPHLLAQRYGWSLSPISYCGEGYWQEHENNNSLGQTWEHRLGRYYVQDASSMLPVELFELSGVKAPLILDMAASPGGKTTHIISKTGDKGLVIANDSSPDRIQALRVVLQNWGSLRHAITQFQGERFGQWFPNTFDAVLLDAPCSMQNLRPTETRPMRPVSEKEENTLAKRQGKLLESALFAVKPGGQIVYATCTLSPEEDEAVLDWLISKYPNAVMVEELGQKLAMNAPGIKCYGDTIYAPAVKYAFRLWPHRVSSSGFFCVRLTKMNEIDGKHKEIPSFDISKTDFKPLDNQSTMKLSDVFEQFGIKLTDDYIQHDLSLWQRGDTIFLFPDRYFREIGFLPLRSLGLPVARIEHDSFTPDHYFLTRCFYENNLPSTIIDDELTALWQSGQSIPATPGTSLQLLQTEDSEFLGIGKQSGGAMKNLLPRRMIL